MLYIVIVCFSMKDKKGYKRKLIKTTISNWTGRVRREWLYIWKDGTQEKRITYSDY